MSAASYAKPLTGTSEALLSITEALQPKIIHLHSEDVALVSRRSMKKKHETQNFQANTRAFE